MEKTLLALSLLLALSSTSQAASVTYDEGYMDTVYSQPILKQYINDYTYLPYGEDYSLDIRFNQTVEFVSPDFLDIDSESEMYSLWSNHFGTVKTVNAFFVDTVTYCGGISGSFGGCATTNSNDLVLNSQSASIHPILLAHELGHNLNMNHTETNPGDLMYLDTFSSTNIDLYNFSGYLDMFPNVVNGETIPPANSPVQGSFETGFYVEITPVLVTASATPVPVPASVFLMMSGLAVFATANFRGRSQTV
ncbi:MAG: hypothetical protein ABW168_12295 [Sedimenticola sp.]